MLRVRLQYIYAITIHVWQSPMKKDAEKWQSPRFRVRSGRTLARKGRKKALGATPSRRLVKRVDQALETLIPLSVVLAFAGFWIGTAVYFYHLVGPGWLNGGQLEHLRTLLFSGAIGATLSAHAKRFLS
jgi:hypothetical protein